MFLVSCHVTGEWIFKKKTPGFIIFRSRGNETWGQNVNTHGTCVFHKKKKEHKTSTYMQAFDKPPLTSKEIHGANFYEVTHFDIHFWTPELHKRVQVQKWNHFAGAISFLGHPELVTLTYDAERLIWANYITIPKPELVWVILIGGFTYTTNQLAWHQLHSLQSTQTCFQFWRNPWMEEKTWNLHMIGDFLFILFLFHDFTHPFATGWVEMIFPPPSQRNQLNFDLHVGETDSWNCMTPEIFGKRPDFPGNPRCNEIFSPPLMTFRFSVHS